MKTGCEKMIDQFCIKMTEKTFFVCEVVKYEKDKFGFMNYTRSFEIYDRDIEEFYLSRYSRIIFYQTNCLLNARLFRLELMAMAKIIWI